MGAHPSPRLLLRLHVGGLLDTLIQNAVVVRVTRRSENKVTDIGICTDAEGAKENPQGNVCLNAWHRRAQQLNLRVLRVVHDFDSIRLWNLVVIGANALNLNHLHLLIRVPIVTEYDGAIGCHALL